MRNIFTFLAVVFAASVLSGSGFSQTPTYNLVVRNMTLNSPTDNELEFDIYMIRTGATPLDYAAGRYNFYFNPLIANGGVLTYSFVSGFSDLPPALQPTGASITANRLNMTINAFPGAGNGYDISNVFPGTRICRMKIATSAPVFALEPLALAWNNPGSLNPPRTVVYAYNDDGDEVVITTPLTHSIDSSGLGGGVLPVELTAFTAAVTGNIVKLNWLTSSELNNAGFDVERRNGNGAWKKIGFVPGAGTTLNPTEYSYSDRVGTGSYNYRLKQTDVNGNFEYFELSQEVNVGSPVKFDLQQNYPNPFNPATVIGYEIPVDSKVSMKLYDMTGKEVMTLVSGFQAAGYYSVKLNGSGLNSGVYFYSLISESNGQTFNATKKLILTK